MKNMKKYMFCNNCGKQGHLYHRCKKPISSIGIIAFRKSKTNNKYEYLMICRKDSLGFVDFMRGKYPLFNKFYIQNIINEMTNKEKHDLLTNDFKTLWENLWGSFVGCQYRGEEKNSSEKFIKIKESTNDISLRKLIENSPTNWITPEWGFPKGRRNYQENDLTCALREFQEETGYSKSQLNVIHNLMPFEEIFTGSNMKSYKHKYFIAYMNQKYESVQDFQFSEVSQVKWFTLEKCLEVIRPYNLEKKELIKNIDRVLHKYRLIL
tara:strand:+ start:352 stop:1149 length:798 start_codon:yes stop_codon:yes gene_type:complete